MQQLSTPLEAVPLPHVSTLLYSQTSSIKLQAMAMNHN